MKIVRRLLTALAMVLALSTTVRAQDMDPSTTRIIRIYVAADDLTQDLESVVYGLQWLAAHTDGKNNLNIKGGVYRTFDAAIAAKEAEHSATTETYLVSHGSAVWTGEELIFLTRDTEGNVIERGSLTDKTNTDTRKFFGEYGCDLVSRFAHELGEQIAVRHGMDWSRVCERDGDYIRWKVYPPQRVTAEDLRARLLRIWLNPYYVSTADGLYTIRNTIFDILSWGDSFGIQLIVSQWQDD